jgi:hypothetical protein
MKAFRKRKKKRNERKKREKKKKKKKTKKKKKKLQKKSARDDRPENWIVDTGKKKQSPRPESNQRHPDNGTTTTVRCSAISEYV